MGKLASAVRSAKLFGFFERATVGHAFVLGPMLAIHEARRLRRLEEEREGGPWEWNHGASVRQALPTVWQMTGRWRARRAVTLKESKLASLTESVVPQLAKTLNGRGIESLRDLSRADARTHDKVSRAIHEAVLEISKGRRTNDVEPVLGSKVLHHFFPSLVPVFDTALIRNGVLRTDRARSHTSATRWSLFSRPEEAGGPAMLQFHDYFTLCLEQIASAPAVELKRTRTRLGQGFASVMPHRVVADRKSLLWKLDAKVAEYCLVSEAKAEGLV